MLEQIQAEPGQLHRELHHAAGTWSPILTDPLRQRAIEAALTVAERLRDPDKVREIARLAYSQSPFPMEWVTAGFAQGFAGLATFYSYVAHCFPQRGWDQVAQQYLRLAAASTQQSAIATPGLMIGTSGMAFALYAISDEGQRHQQTIAKLNQSLYEQVQQQKWQHTEAGEGVADYDYDIILGASGILAYLITLHTPDEAAQRAMEILLGYLTWLAAPDQPLGQERWYVPVEHLPDLQRDMYPDGNFNCGLAHGIPGPLAAMSLAWIAGYRYPGVREAITYLSGWLVRHRISNGDAIGWPNAIPRQLASAPDDWQSLLSSRAAWCYGTPGIARSLWLAGRALDDASLRQVALDAMEDVWRLPVAARGIDAPTSCHGVAGLLQITLRFAHESDSIAAREQIPLLVTQILDSFDPEYPVGFRDIEMNNTLVDQPGWLTGAPGTAMALLAAATDALPTWDRVLVIA